MRILGKIALTILAVPLLLIGLIAFTFRFQLLDAKFWENTFEKNNIYASLTDILKKSVEEQTIKEGGSVSEIKLITDLATKENIKDFFNRNLENLLNFANGKAGELTVYIPISRAPKGFLPATFANLPETMSVTALLTKLNIMGITPDQIQYIPLVGRGVTLLVILDAALILAFLAGFYLLAEKGTRFIAPGIAFVLSGLIVVGVYVAGTQIRIQMAKDLVLRANPAEVLLGTIAPPLLAEILRVWVIVGVAGVLLGIMLMLVKKP